MYGVIKDQYPDFPSSEAAASACNFGAQLCQLKAENADSEAARVLLIDQSVKLLIIAGRFRFYHDTPFDMTDQELDLVMESIDAYVMLGPDEQIIEEDHE